MPNITTRQRFTVDLYRDGNHLEPHKTAGCTTTLPELGVTVERWRGANEVCCWYAYNAEDEEVMQRPCRHEGKK